MLWVCLLDVCFIEVLIVKNGHVVGEKSWHALFVCMFTFHVGGHFVTFVREQMLLYTKAALFICCPGKWLRYTMHCNRLPTIQVK